MARLLRLATSTPPSPRVLWCASMTLRLVLAAYGLANVRPYRVDAGRNNEHWYVGAGLVLRRYGPFRSDAAIDYEHAILGQLRERGWPVAVPIPSDAGQPPDHPRNTRPRRGRLPPTWALVMRAGDGNRTRTISLGS
jgi:hypothetical protein